MMIVGEAVDQIENNPILQRKVIDVIKSGETKSFKEAINHKFANILLATLEE